MIKHNFLYIDVSSRPNRIRSWRPTTLWSLAQWQSRSAHIPSSNGRDQRKMGLRNQESSFQSIGRVEGWENQAVWKCESSVSETTLLKYVYSTNMRMYRRPLKQSNSVNYDNIPVTTTSLHPTRASSVDHSNNDNKHGNDGNWHSTGISASSSEHDNQETNAWSSDYSNSEDEFTILEENAVPVSLWYFVVEFLIGLWSYGVWWSLKL